jgi:hypothetical protein
MNQGFGANSFRRFFACDLRGFAEGININKPERGGHET